MIPRAYQKEKEEWIMSETENQDLLAMTHLGEEPSKYMKSVTPPIFMNSLHVFDTVDEYFSVDIFVFMRFLFESDLYETSYMANIRPA